MSLAINHNLMSGCIANALSAHYGNLATSTRRLSSGLRINSAADDAAGLAIRELQRADIAAFHQGVRNLQDGISMAQYADGTLQQFCGILQRLTELAEQAATGTYDSTQRKMIADEAGELTREIERMQNAAKFNGVDLFTKEDTILIHWGKNSEDYIPLNLSKLTSSTVGGELDGTNMAYSVLRINGGNLGRAVTGNSIQQSTSTTLADQTIYIGQGSGMGNPAIEVSAANNNNTAEALAAEILALNWDGIRYAKTSSELTLKDWDRSDLIGSEGDIVKFKLAIGLEGVSDPPELTGSYLIGANGTETAQNRHAALKRLVNKFNEDNADSDLTLDGDTIRSTSGRTLSVGEFELFEATSVVISNFGNAPATFTKSGTPIPQSITSFSVDGHDISFVTSSDSATNVSRAMTALKNAGLPIYDNTKFLTDETADWPYDNVSNHKYMLKQNGNSISIIKLNNSFDRVGDEITVSDIKSDQTQMYVRFGSVYSGEKTTINIDGTDVTFAGSLTTAANAINAAGIANVTADVDTTNNRLIIAKTDSETDIAIRYVNDENTGVTFTNLDIDDTGTKGSTFRLNGNEISYQHGTTTAETAANLAAALGAYGTATVSNGNVTFRINDANAHDNIYLDSFSTSGDKTLSLASVAGSSVSGSWAKGYTVKDSNVSITVSSGLGSSGTGIIGRTTTPNSKSGDLDSGLLLHYAFDGTAGAGVSATKQVSAQLINGARLDPDNSSITLIGQDNSADNPTPNGGQYVLLPELAPSDLAQGYSVSIWVNETKMMGKDRGESYVELFGGAIRIFHNDTDGGSTGAAAKSIGFAMGTTNVSSPFNTAERGQWVNYSMTYDGATLSAYKNGALVGQTAARFTPDSRYVDRNALGSHWWSGDNQSARFVGSMDEFRLYDHALTKDEVTALANSRDSNPTASPTQQYDPGIIAGPVTTTASKASASISTLKNAAGGASSTLSRATIKEGADTDTAIAEWRDDGVRQTGAVGSNPEVGILKSQEHGATPDNVWASVAGTSEIYTDPEFAFTFTSSVSGRGADGGAFYQDAFKAADMDYRTQKANQKTFITDFDNVAGETISFTLQGVDIKYIVPPDSGNPQKDNAWALLDALKNKSADLAAAGISFSISAGEDGVYVFNDAGGPISFSNYSGSAATDSGFTLKNIDNENQYFKIHENSDDPNKELLNAVMKTFTAISQIDYRTQAGAQSALPILKAALNQVSKTRADIGAFISVLENQTTAVQVQSQNYQVAESRISDMDIAQEMTNFVRSQILTQAATAMLAQANILPQMALKLIG